VGFVLDYNLPYHIIQEWDDETYHPKLSFKSLSEAKEFIKFAPTPKLIIVKTKELKNYYLGLEYKKHEF